MILTDEEKLLLNTRQCVELCRYQCNVNVYHEFFQAILWVVPWPFLFSIIFSFSFHKLCCNDYVYVVDLSFALPTSHIMKRKSLVSAILISIQNM